MHSSQPAVAPITRYVKACTLSPITLCDTPLSSKLSTPSTTIDSCPFTVIFAPIFLRSEIRSISSGRRCGFRIVDIPSANTAISTAFSVAPVERMGSVKSIADSLAPVLFWAHKKPSSVQTSAPMASISRIWMSYFRSPRRHPAGRGTFPSPFFASRQPSTSSVSRMERPFQSKCVVSTEPQISAIPLLCLIFLPSKPSICSSTVTSSIILG